MTTRGTRTTARLAALLLACGGGCQREPAPQGERPAPSLEQAKRVLDEAAKKERVEHARMSFEEFKATVYREPFPGGKFIVNGDTPIADEKGLREFFEKEIRAEPTRPDIAMLVVHRTPQGTDAIWNDELKRALGYCVSSQFGGRHAAVLEDMREATAAWEEAAAVDFVHRPAEDGDCDARNADVVFDVRPVDVGGEYLARAFFPNEPRAARNVLIDQTALELDPNDELQLVGVLRHELGHALGFRHEHTRPASGPCFEDTDWRPLTDYDPFSVMHYPQCDGLGDWSLELTHQDRNGAACLYGPAAAFTVDDGVCQPRAPLPGGAGQPQARSFPAQSVAQGEQKEYPPFAVTPGSVFEATISGSAASDDPDLYLRVGGKPSLTSYHCRPFLLGPNESCAITVQANQGQAFVMVHGYGAGDYRLDVRHVPPAP